MATLKEYFEKDFENTIRVSVKIPIEKKEIEAVILYDFSAYCSFVSCYFNEKLPYGFFEDFIERFSTRPNIIMGNAVRLPNAKTYHGSLGINNTDPFQITSTFLGEPIPKNSMELKSTGRLFIYSEYNLKDDEIASLYKYSKKKDIDLQFRSKKYKDMRSNLEHPMAFISHDNRDKDAVAKTIAVGLQKYQCPVWYDEFSLNIGDNLRMTIEKGLKECKKCVLILSPNFLSNNGWTKTEFDSIFTRQILEEQSLILPIWYNITKNEVYQYSPSLLNIKGLDWNTLGSEEIIRRLARAIDV